MRLALLHRPGSQREERIVGIGDTDLIGSKLVQKLREMGEEVLAASSDDSVNTLTGKGLAEPLASAQVVVDVLNSPRSRTAR